ncbi:threonine/serine dehydratase [Mesorhizobium sp. ZC-5]|uniref:threonine ammonia-lyase n=1 Tax=Mesorhizobium sp. ZC-5 TaxID=2986066 RepID=UPI0021E7E9B3|nr:pyridoxal-phosphate dependent enzyme [Mesorhizobium sp. ZC-5]MCV3241927.1 pyridoxal-phosphate dependent enzyme [Mesorhizobium sp. ZC-5]
MTPITESGIARTRALIDPVFLGSPIVRQAALDTALGCSLTLKLETLNPIRSFKGRGTEALMASLENKPSHVVATSSGNFGQGLARAATRRGVKATIFSGEDDNPAKLEAMRRLGAEVRLVARDEDSKAAARKAALDMGALYIEDGAHPEIAAGAGTMAVELLARCDGLDAILVQIGDGALVTGVGSWIKATSPKTRVIGVTALGSPGMRTSLRLGKPVGLAPDTIADGMAIHTPIASAVEEVAAVIDDIVEVDDEAMLDAMALLLGSASLVAEPSGAAGVAAIMCNAEMFRGQKVAAIVTGANVRPELLAQAATRLAPS